VRIAVSGKLFDGRAERVHVAIIAKEKGRREAGPFLVVTKKNPCQTDRG
jgi:hypothetical protein